MKFKSKAHMAQELLAGKTFKHTPSNKILHFSKRECPPFRFGDSPMGGAWNQYNEDIWEEIKQPHVHQALMDSYKNGQAWQYKEADQAAWHNIKIAGVWIQPVWNEATEYRLHHYNDLIQEFNAGAEIEFFDSRLNGWVSTSSPSWDEGIKYRVKPKTKTVYEWMTQYKNGVWTISDVLRTEEDALQCYGGFTYQKTGRSFEVPA